MHTYHNLIDTSNAGFIRCVELGDSFITLWSNIGMNGRTSNYLEEKLSEVIPDWKPHYHVNEKFHEKGINCTEGLHWHFFYEYKPSLKDAVKLLEKIKNCCGVEYIGLNLINEISRKI